MPLVWTAPPKWWKSILTRDQDLYDKQSLLLGAHQYHLNGRQKQKKKSAPCALFPKMPLKILKKHSSLLKGPRFRQGFDKGLFLRGGVSRFGMVSVPKKQSLLFLFYPPLYNFASGITNEKKKIKALMIGLKQLVSYGRFFFTFLASRTIVRNQSIRAGYCRIWCISSISAEPIWKLAGCTSSVTWALSWNDPPSISIALL